MMDIKENRVWFFLPLIFLLTFVKTQEGGIKLEDIAPSDYDYLHPPLNSSEPLHVDITINKLCVRSIDESDMSISVTIELWQIWYDYRLKYPSWASGKKFQILDSIWINKIWNPKLFFMNSVDGKLDNIITPSSFFWLGDDSKIYYCSRVILKLICEMNLKDFPHDKQKCGIQMGSAIYTSRDIILQWDDDRNTIQIFELQQYEITDMTRTHFLSPFGKNNLSCLQLSMDLNRRTGYYLINVYIPTVLIVIMSMLTFWIPYDAVPARITLGVTSLLTIITKQYQASMPNVSYIVALNVWLSCCIGFVFLSLLEFAVVIACSTNLRREGGGMQHASDFVLPMVMLRSNGTWSTKNSWTREDKKKKRMMAPKRIDSISRFFFPLAFIVFCVTYWQHYH